MLDYATLMRADVATDLRSQQQADKVIALVLGDYATTFTGFDLFIYIEASLAEDDGETVFKPNILDEEQNGRWHKINRFPVDITQTGAGTRSLDSSFVVDEDKDAIVIYSVSASPALTLTAGQTATVILEISEDEITWSPLSISENGLNGTLVVGLNVSSPATGIVAGIVPKGMHVRLNTSGTTGGVTITVEAQQETLIY